MSNNKKNKKVSIILLNYNTSNDLIECIESLDNIQYSNYEIIVVDNCSRKDQIEKLNNFLKKRNDIIFISNSENNGFAGGNNLGIKYALENKTDYLLLLNADTIVDEYFLDILVKTVEEDPNNNAIVTGKIMYYNDDKRIWYGGGYIDWNNYIGKHFGEGVVDSDEFNETKNITFSSGCLMLINLSLNFNKYLSEEYFMYYEDVDYCAKVLEAGYKIIYNPNSKIYHKVGTSSGGEQSAFTVRWSNRGRYIFMNKYKYRNNKFKFFIIKSKFIITRILKFILFYIRGEFEKGNELCRGILDAITIKK